MHASARPLGRGQQTIDERGGHAVRRGGKQGGARRAANHGLDGIEIGEFQLGIGATQVRERTGHRSAGLAVRKNRGDLELRMTGDQAQQLAGHVAGTAQHDRRSGAHSPATFDSRTWLKPKRAMM